MNKDHDESVSTLFAPRGQFKGLAAHFDRVPHYLLRVTSPGSQGINERTRVGSPAVKAGLDRDDLFSKDLCIAKPMVERHLRWDAQFASDNLVSWCSSLHFVLYHAIQRQAIDPGPPDFQDIHLAVLDTRKLPRGTFIPALSLLKAFDIDSDEECRHEYCQAEYFTQGVTHLAEAYSEGGLVYVSLGDMIQFGLFELFPPFRELQLQQRLSVRCLEHRAAFEHGPVVPSRIELSCAERIAACACSVEALRPVVMTLLLSLKPRYRADGAILDAFRKNKMGTLVTDDALEDYRATLKTIPEYRQFVMMIHDVHADTQRNAQNHSFLNGDRGEQNPARSPQL